MLILLTLSDGLIGDHFNSIFLKFPLMNMCYLYNAGKKVHLKRSARI